MEKSISITTSTTTECCDPLILCTTTTVFLPTCVNPFDHLCYVADVYAKANNISFEESFFKILEDGLFLDNCGACCSDCFGEYVLANNSTYNLYRSSSLPPQQPIVGAKVGGEGECCVNYTKYPDLTSFNYNVEDKSLVNENGAFKYCCNNFNECIKNIHDYFANNGCGYESIYFTYGVNGGIVEQGTFDGNSLLCKVLENFSKYSENNCFDEFFYNFLNAGIVISCNTYTPSLSGISNVFFIGSVQTFKDLVND